MKTEKFSDLIQCQDSLNEIINHQLLLEAVYEKLDEMYFRVGNDGRGYLDEISYFLTLYRDFGVKDSLREVVSSLSHHVPQIKRR